LSEVIDTVRQDFFDETQDPKIIASRTMRFAPNATITSSGHFVSLVLSSVRLHGLPWKQKKSLKIKMTITFNEEASGQFVITPWKEGSGDVKWSTWEVPRLIFEIPVNLLLHDLMILRVEAFSCSNPNNPLLKATKPDFIASIPFVSFGLDNVKKADVVPKTYDIGPAKLSFQVNVK
jgi:hypothetical protein